MLHGRIAECARAAAVESESELPDAGLHQLLHPVANLIGLIPPRQAAALRAAFGLDTGGEDRFGVSAAVLSLLAEAAEKRPVLCLVDDAHWLDGVSADALTFAAPSAGGRGGRADLRGARRRRASLRRTRSARAAPDRPGTNGSRGGEALRRRRRRADARVQLRLAYEGFDRLGARPWADLARTELRATGETARTRDPSTASQLTPQELEITRLVGAGATNREVAGPAVPEPAHRRLPPAQRCVSWPVHNVEVGARPASGADPGLAEGDLGAMVVLALGGPGGPVLG